MTRQHTFYADHLVDALLEEGIPPEQIWELDGWKENEQGYYWTDIFTDQHHGYDGVANGHFNHHTASTSYTPFVKNGAGQTKATQWVGLRRGNRLYQNGDGVPTVCLASAGPADYSAGTGVRDYIKLLAQSQEALAQTRSDDSPKFYGNRYVLNTEIICDGVGGAIDGDTWDLLMVFNAALSRLHDAEAPWNGFHQGFTRRKIDYRDGRYANASDTIEAMWVEIAVILEGNNMWANDITDKTWRVWFKETDVLGTLGDYRYYCKNDGTVDFEAEGEPAWGDGAADGRAAYAEKVHALNIGFQGYATAIEGLS